MISVSLHFPITKKSRSIIQQIVSVNETNTLLQFSKPHEYFTFNESKSEQNCTSVS